MADQRQAPRFIVRRFARVQVGIERSLGIDHDAARIGHAHQQVGAQRATLGGDVFLLGEVAVFGHAGEFDHATQRDFAPASAHFRPAQRRGETARLALQEILHLHEVFDLAGEFARGLAAFAFDGLGLFFLARQRHLERLHELLDGFFAFLERVGGRGLIASEHFARELEKGFAVGIERERAKRSRPPARTCASLCAQQFGSARAHLGFACEPRARASARALQPSFCARRAARSVPIEIADDRRGEGGDDGDEPGGAHALPLLLVARGGRATACRARRAGRAAC